MDLIKTGKYIKEQRDKLGLSQNELSEKVHVTRQAISNWENGKSLPDSDVLLSLSELFHVTINDILCGESMEETVLELVDENNKKIHRIKKMMIVFSSIIAVLIISFFVFYFIENYNSIKVYKVSASSEHFRIADGIIISTSSNTYFKLGKIDIKNDEKITVDLMKLYYEKGNKKEIIFENDVNDRLYVDRAGYEELYRRKFEEYKNNLYLEITYNGKEKEIIKLRVIKEFSNSLMMMFDESKVIKNKTPQEVQEKITNFLKEENIQFEKNIQIRNDIAFTTISPVSYEQTSTIEDAFPKVEDPQPTNQEQEETKEVEEPTETIEIDEPTEMVEIEEKEIDYEEILNLIETYGYLEGRLKILEYNIDNQIITISKNKKIITISMVDDSIREEYVLRITNDYVFSYQLNVDDVEQMKINGNLEEMMELYPEIVYRMNMFLRLIYQEIE